MASGFFQNLVARFTGAPVDWDDLEESLIRSDMGVPMAMHLLDTLQKRRGSITGETAAQVAREEILKILPQTRPIFFPHRPSHSPSLWRA